MAKSKEEILDLVRKLMSMTVDHGCTPEEAANAASRAQAFLQQHHLEMSEVSTEQAPEGVINTILDTDAGNNGEWKYLLLHYIAMFNFCRVVKKWVPKGGRSAAYLFGDSLDVQVVTELHGWIVEQLERAAKESWAKYGGEDRRPVFLRSFYPAAVRVIRDRLSEQQAEFLSKYSNSTAIMAVSEVAVNKAVEETIGPTRLRSLGGRGSSSAGHAAGILAGLMTDIGKPSKRLEE